MNTTENRAAQRLLEAFTRYRRAGWRHTPVGGLTPSEMMVLWHVMSTTQPGCGIKVSDISNHLNVAPPTVTQQINNLEANGYVQRSMDKEDRRAVRVTLTAKGEQALKEAHDALMASLTGLVEYLGEEDSEKLADLMSRVSTYFHEVRESGSQQPHTGDDNT